MQDENQKCPDCGNLPEGKAHQGKKLTRRQETLVRSLTDWAKDDAKIENELAIFVETDKDVEEDSDE